MSLKLVARIMMTGVLALSLNSTTLKLAMADDAPAAGVSQTDDGKDRPAAADDASGGDEGRNPRGGGGGGYSAPRSNYSAPRSNYGSSQPRNMGNGFTARTNPGNGGTQYRDNSTGRDVSRREYERRTGGGQQSQPQSQPRQQSRPIDVGGGFTARTNPQNGGIQYRDERTGRDISRKEFEAQRGVTGRVNPQNGGIQFRDNNTGRDISQRNVRKMYGGRPISDYRPTTVGGQSWNNYRSTTTNIHIDNSINYHGGYRSGFGYGYYNGGSWYGYHPLYLNGGWGYYDIYGSWSPIVDATYLALLAANMALANQPMNGVTYVQTGAGINYAAQGQVIYDMPYDESKVVEETVTDPDGNQTTTVTRTNTSTGVW